MTEEQEREKFEKEIDLFTEMACDLSLRPEDYYKAFTEMCE